MVHTTGFLLFPHNCGLGQIKTCVQQVGNSKYALVTFEVPTIMAPTLYLVVGIWMWHQSPTSLPSFAHVSVVGFHRIPFFLCLLSCRHFIKKCCKEILKMMYWATYAEDTHKNHQTQCRTYLYFCFYFGFEPPPATINVVCLYCQFLSHSMTPLGLQLCQWG